MKIQKNNLIIVIVIIVLMAFYMLLVTFEILKNSLIENEDAELFLQKWNGIINKLEFKPFKNSVLYCFSLI